MFAQLIYPQWPLAETEAGRREKPRREEELAPTMPRAQASAFQYSPDWGASQDPEIRI